MLTSDDILIFVNIDYFEGYVGICIQRLTTYICKYVSMYMWQNSADRPRNARLRPKDRYDSKGNRHPHSTPSLYLLPSPSQGSATPQRALSLPPRTTAAATPPRPNSSVASRWFLFRPEDRHRGPVSLRHRFRSAPASVSAWTALSPEALLSCADYMPRSNSSRSNGR
jgi:hypothetical protein